VKRILPVRRMIFLVSAVVILFAEKTSFKEPGLDTIHTLFLGEEKVWVHVYKRPGTDITLINLHDNENTAAEAGLSFIKKHGGRFIEIRHGRGREIVVRLNGKMNHFDPNRMFSDDGLRSSLKYFHNNTNEVFAYAVVFRDSVVNILNAEKNKVIISVHNNTPDKMTIHDFLPGEWYGRDSRKVFINPEQDHDNFFIVTDEALFTVLSGREYNVALLSENPPDRGMLIDFCSDLGALCVTVEAEHEKLAKQEEMLEVLWEVLSEKGKESGQ